jgi:hypothetical protein
VGELAREYRDLPVREIVSNSLFRRRIEDGWHPHDIVAVKGIDY